MERQQYESELKRLLHEKRDYEVKMHLSEIAVDDPVEHKKQLRVLRKIERQYNQLLDEYIEQFGKLGGT